MTDYILKPHPRNHTREVVVLFQKKPIQRIFHPKPGWRYCDVDGKKSTHVGEYRP